MKKNAKLLIAILAFAPLTACALAESTSPRADVWVAYQGLVHGEEIVPQNGGYAHNVDDGGLPSFRIRVRGLSTGRSAARPELRWSSVDIDPDTLTNPAASEGAAMLRGIVSLALPEANEGSSLASYRQGIGPARRWGEERIRRSRDVAMMIDLRADAASSAAQLCRQVAIDVPAGATQNRCTIEAMVDASDGWPLVARIRRAVEGVDGARLFETVTFERIEQAQPLR
jgi:hypothetical protein